MALSTHKISRKGISPIIAFAIHDGSDLRPDIESNIALTYSERLREEDPFTGAMTQVCKTQVIGLRSRFEVDLNRPREKAIYRTPEDAWGLKVWKTEMQECTIQDSLAIYDEFYRDVESLLSDMLKEFPKLVVYDIHSYNHRRDGEFSPVADVAENPEVNVGTGTMDRNYWAPVIDTFVESLGGKSFYGRSWDVRENVKFRGGEFSKWIHRTFPRQVCSISIEFKKVFMDEWSGKVDLKSIEAIMEQLTFTIPHIERELKQL